MKKLIYVFAAATFIFGACSKGQGYKIKGSVEGAQNGDTVLMQKVENHALLPTDTAIIVNGEFVFQGKQDSAVTRYLTYRKGPVQYTADFFLENGNLNAKLERNSVVNGTPNNDVYQDFKNYLYDFQKGYSEIMKSLQDSSITKEEKEAKMSQLDAKSKEITNRIVADINKNYNNLVGLHLIKNFGSELSVEEIESVLNKLDAKFQNDPTVVQLKEYVDKTKKTAIGKKFIDFAMKSPEGKDVKLSDYVGKSKYLLVDFWASWCGPCRSEMPNLLKTYAAYKKKGFQIVGVSLDENENAWKGAIKEMKMPWPQMSDLKGWKCEGSQLYAVVGIPFTVLIDKEGLIVEKGLRGEKLDEKLAKLLK